MLLAKVLRKDIFNHCRETRLSNLRERQVTRCAQETSEER